MANDALSATTDCHALVNAGQTDKAIECYRGVLKKNVADLDARNGLAAALAKQKKYQSALTEFEDVLRRQPADGVAMNGKAMMLIALNRIDEGFAVMQKAIETNPDNIQALHNLALFNYNHDHPEVAIPLWQRVLTIAPDDPDALVGLGEILMRQGKLDEALGFFNKVIAKDDRHARAIYMAGKVLAQSKPVESVEYFERVVLLAPDDPEPWYDLGLVRMRVGETRLAGQAFNQAHLLAPDDWRPIMELGKAHYEMRRYDDAIDHFEGVLKRKPPPDAKVAVKFHTGLVREAQNNKKKAADEYGQALKLDPNHVPSMLNLASLHLEEKRWNDAKPLLDRALTIVPQNAIARFNLGKLYLAQGKTEAGNRELKALVAALPESDPLRQEAEELIAGRKKPQ
jgi:tetratricopeptide (TPR) repeat protein